VSVDPKHRSVLSELRKPPLMQPAGTVPAALEEGLLGSVSEAQPARTRKEKVATVPVTFHLPVALRDRLKVTAQARQKTMLEMAVEALEDYLGRRPVSEAELRRLLGI